MHIGEAEKRLSAAAVESKATSIGQLLADLMYYD
jgi:hypothetical protein